MEQNKRNINKLTMLGMMTALVFVSNYLRIILPIAIGGLISGIAQGRAAVAGISLLAKRLSEFS